MKPITPINIPAKGFTLVELMVAATLGLIILAGAISMFVSNKRIYTEQEEMSRLQENARFAMTMIIQDLRMAGYSGCSGAPDQVNNNINGNTDPTDLFFYEPLEGSEAATNWEPSNSSEQVAAMLANTDGVTVRYFEPTDVHVMNPALTPASNQIHISAESGLQQGDAVAISDCGSLDAVVITAAPATSGCGAGTQSTGPTDACKTTITHNAGTPPAGAEPGNANATLSKAYNEEAEILRYVTHRYYVGNDANGAPMLFRQSGFNQVDAMVEGVENLQVMYGEDTSGNDAIADTYVAANAVSNWDDVVSVRVSILVRSIEEYGVDTDTKTYSLLGTDVGPINDRRRRRVFTATVDVRNRSLQ